MIKRDISSKIIQASKKIPVISITGPRQSGKTTLIKKLFADYQYFNLENPSIREYAENDPQALLNENKKLVIDEIQQVPKLFSYIQVLVDEDKTKKFVISGSQNFLISEKISQTLAGRVAIYKLLPLSIPELSRHRSLKTNLHSQIVTGFYPRLYDQKLNPNDWYQDYTSTYLERDVRLIKSITNLSLFHGFLKLCAGRTGQVLNLSSLANDAGITVNTVKAWLSVLEASYVLFKLPPYYKNFRKRLTKSPKIHFYDSGLVCSLLGIKTAQQLKQHPLIGNIFESFIISEYLKTSHNFRRGTDYYYFRDKTGNEIDLLYEEKNKLNLVEIKSSQTYQPNFQTAFDYFSKISQEKTINRIVYGGNKSSQRTNFKLCAWKSFSKT